MIKTPKKKPVLAREREARYRKESLTNNSAKDPNLELKWKPIQKHCQRHSQILRKHLPSTPQPHQTLHNHGQPYPSLPKPSQKDDGSSNNRLLVGTGAGGSGRSP